MAGSGQGARILIVDDDPIVVASLVEFLSGDGFDVSACASGEEALAALRVAEQAGGKAMARPFNLVVTDVAMPGMSGQELLERVRREHPDVVVVMLTSYGTIESAVRAIRAGAFDYLSKPIVDSELRLTLERALAQQVLLSDNVRLRRALGQHDRGRGIIGRDSRLRQAFEVVEAVAPSKATVLITGESGTGKSMLARAVHKAGPRRDGPFVELHCGSIPETLLESELFGHVAGAFTGAHIDKAGRFVAADGGTIFLDEINSASPAMQLKLLRVLQERRFEPVGSTKTIDVDVRVVLASNQPLEQLLREGKFREDLYYRINVVRVELPALRERSSDVPELARHFVEKYAAEHDKLITGISDEAMAALNDYAYPGNVRELENIIERAVLLARRPTIGPADLPAAVSGAAAELTKHGQEHELHLVGGQSEPMDWAPMPLQEALKAPEKQILLQALRANDWNRQRTADQLEINRTTLYKKMKAYGLDRLAG